MAESLALVARLLKAPDLAKVVPQLQPEVLHRVIETCGLEDCAEVVALATPRQLERVLDLDLWRPRGRGGDEAFDADRFGLWLTVLMQSGAAVAVEKLMGLDVALVITGLSRHAAVFDHAAIASYTTLDGVQIPGRSTNRDPASEIGGYVIEARLTSAWEPIVELLACMESEHAEYFHRLMRGCVRLSNGPREDDGLHDLLEDVEQHLFDLASGRKGRREEQGYVAPAEARAFLRAGRDVRLDAVRPPAHPIARGYFRDMEPSLTAEPDPPGDQTGSDEFRSDDHSPDKRTGVIEVLRDAGVLTPPQPRALPGAADPQASRLSLIHVHLASHPDGSRELAFLANTLIAGCSIQDRPFTAREASDAAAATCNLGLENWPRPWPDPDLVTAFQVGWVILHRDVCRYATERLIDVLTGMRCSDRDTQLRLDGLRRDLVRRAQEGEPWRARSAFDVLIMLDTPAWATLLTLIDECPAIHAALSASRQRRTTVSPTDFEFISHNSQIASVHEFMASLPSALTG